MAEAITAVGLATNIIQLVDVARNITTTAREVSRSVSGLPKEAEQFRQHANRVCGAVELIVKSGPNAKYDDTFRAHATELRTHVEACLAELDTLSVTSKKKWYGPWKTAMKVWWNKEQMEQSMKMVYQMGDQVTMHIVTVHLPAMDTKLDNLYAHTTESDEHLTQDMNRLLATVTDLHTKHNEGAALLQATNKWFRDQDEIEVQRTCLRQLYFPQLQRREEEVKHAHKKTFGWIMEEELKQVEIHDTGRGNSAKLITDHEHTLGEEGPRNNKFKAFLRSSDEDNKVFWIAGKPGAGKSTLMKFLAHHEALPHLVEQWVGSDTLVVAHHFFWYHGEFLQRSIQGMLQKLLFQILRQHRRLILIAFSHQDWMLGGEKYSFPTSTLIQALDRVLDSASDNNMRFLFFIDGLDEYNERKTPDEPASDLLDLIKFIRTMHQRPAVKICLSSRSWPVFQAEYGRDRRLYFPVHELTKKDIRSYVQETLSDERVFKQSVADDPGYMRLIDEITDAAQGVFFWVYLACRSLLEGVLNDDRIHDLEHRLHGLPQALEEMYQQMMNSIAQEYWKNAARSLLVASRESMPHGVPSILAHMYLDDVEYTRAMSLETMDLNSLRKDTVRMSQRMDTICKGLLEADLWTEPLRQSPLLRGQLGPVGRWYMLDQTTFRFSHRTVADFLGTEEMGQYLVGKACMSSDLTALKLQSAVATLQTLLSVVKSAQVASQDEKQAIAEKGKVESSHKDQNGDKLADVKQIIFAKLDLYYALAQQVIASEQVPPHWDELVRIMSRPLGGQHATGLNIAYETEREFRHPEVSMAVYFNVAWLCRQAIDRVRTSPEPFDGTIDLFDAIDLENYEVAEVLLENGADPNCEMVLRHLELNRPLDSLTPWRLFLTRWCDHLHTSPSKSGSPEAYMLALAFREHGADLTTELELAVTKRKRDKVKGLFPAALVRSEEKRAHVIYSPTDVFDFLAGRGGSRRPEIWELELSAGKEGSVGHKSI